MKTFTYIIKDEIGIHARPAGMLAKVAKDFKSEIIIEKNGKSVNATKLMMLMGLGETNAQIFEIHMMMLEDEDYNHSIRNIIESQSVNAEYAVALTSKNFAQKKSNFSLGIDKNEFWVYNSFKWAKTFIHLEELSCR